MTTTAPRTATITAKLIARQILTMADAYATYESAPAEQKHEAGESAAYAELELEKVMPWANFSPKEADRIISGIRTPATRATIVAQARQVVA